MVFEDRLTIDTPEGVPLELTLAGVGSRCSAALRRGPALADLGEEPLARSEAGRVDFISGLASVAPGIEVVEIGGHTPGQLAVIVGTARGETVIASDALHYYEEMAQDRPFAHVTDVPAMYAGFAWLREQAAAGREIVAGHDPQVMQRYPAVAGAARLAVRVG